MYWLVRFLMYQQLMKLHLPQVGESQHSKGIPLVSKMLYIYMFLIWCEKLRVCLPGNS